MIKPKSVYYVYQEGICLMALERTFFNDITNILECELCFKTIKYSCFHMFYLHSGNPSEMTV